MDSEIQQFDVIVVGGGAAGQMAAISAARAGAKVLLLEQMSQLGLKILASGGGRCNLTNLSSLQKFEAVFGKQGRFIRPAMHTISPEDLMDFFAEIGVPTKVDDGGLKVFPKSNKAMHLQAGLRKCYENLGVKLRTATTVVEILVDNKEVKGVKLSNGQKIFANGVILACGGNSWPELGGTGGGYDLASQVGHNIDPVLPALVPLVSRENWPAQLAGVSLNNARISIPLPKQNKAGVIGDILFTHRGITGPAVLDISGCVSELLQKRNDVPINIELIANMGQPQWEETFAKWRTSAGKKHIINLLKEKIPTSLCHFICDQADLAENITPAQLSADKRKKLVALLSKLEMTIKSTEGFKTAFVTRGGVRLKEVDSKTMESRCVKGLFLAGELLNLDGPTGGFNLQWAFASGYLAGLSASKSH